MNPPEDPSKTREQDDGDAPPPERRHLRLVRHAEGDSPLIYRGLGGPKKPPGEGE